MIATFKSINDCTAAPVITAQPAGSTINSGQTASLSVTATGTALGYQWYQGASGVVTIRRRRERSDAQRQSGRHDELLGARRELVWSREQQRRHGHGLQPPRHRHAAALAERDLRIRRHALRHAERSGPFTYQWYEGTSGTTTTPVGTNSASFTTPALTATKSYWVRVTSTCNGSTSVNSSTATLTVSTASSIARRQFAGNSAQLADQHHHELDQPTQAGSLLVAVLSAQHGAAVGNFTPPAGWQLATSYEMANVKSAIYYYPNHPGGRTSETFGVASFRELVLSAHRVHRRDGVASGQGRIQR